MNPLFVVKISRNSLNKKLVKQMYECAMQFWANPLAVNNDILDKF